MTARRSECPLPRRSALGVSLVEVLVALAVFAVNLLAWTAVLQLVFAIVRRIVALEAQVVEDVAFAEVCSTVALVPRFERAKPSLRVESAFGSISLRQSGVTLVEVLVAAAIGLVILLLVAAAVAMASRSSGAVLVASEATVVRIVMPALLHDVVGAAGRGLDVGAYPEAPCGVAVEDGGRRLVLNYVDGGEYVEEHLFASFDGAGRPALYLRRLPHPRQPWVEDVTGLSVAVVDGAGSAWEHWVRLEVEHRALERPLVVAVPLLHHPCVGEAGP